MERDGQSAPFNARSIHDQQNTLHGTITYLCSRWIDAIRYPAQLNFLLAPPRGSTGRFMNGLRIAERFAKALDREDYADAESLLGSECDYVCRGKRYHGPAEIMASYQGNGDAAKAFDAVEYESQVVSQSIGQFSVRFADHLTHGGRQFTFRCEQIIDVNDYGEIVRIEHCDLPGQVEALAEFKKLLV